VDLDPNAYSWSGEEEEKSEDDDDLRPLERFQIDYQPQIVKFKQMLKELKVDVLNTTWEKELPKVIHD